MMKLKQMSSAAALLVLMAGCQQHDGYLITGNIAGDVDGAKVYMNCLSSNQLVAKDSAVIEEGCFKMTGKVDSPARYYFTIDLNAKDSLAPRDEQKLYSFDCYVENSKINIQGDIASLPVNFYDPNRVTKDPVIMGSKTHDAYLAYNKQMGELNDRARMLNKQYIDEYLRPYFEGKEVGNRGVELVKLINTVQNDQMAKRMAYIKENAASVIALDVANEFFNDMFVNLTGEQIDNIMNMLTPAWGQNDRFTDLKADAENAKRLAIGEKFTDIQLFNEAGDTVRLADYIKEGGYTMLEFWASWCSPCRGEIPHLKRAYEKYADKGFRIVSVSLDEREADWKKAMTDEKMNWTQLRDLKGFQGISAEAYNITGIPFSLILDEKGRLYRTNMRGAFLDEFLQNTYDK